MTRIYLIRHGEAEGNIYRRAQGQYESELSAKGERQVAALAERFREEKIDALYSSDLRRTQKTAGAITKYHDLPLHLDARLRELALGAWEDVPFGDLEWRYGEQMDYFNNDPERWHAEGAESFAQLKARMRAVIDELAEKHAGETVVCCSHGMAIRALLSDILGVPSAQIFKVPHGDNTAVSLLEAENGQVRVSYMNDVSHLPPSLSTFARQDWWKESDHADLNNVHFERFDVEKHPAAYMEFYAKTWEAVHGSQDGFYAPVYYSEAVRHARANPDAIVTIRRQDGETAGITELDTERGAAEGYGWICLCYIEEKFRRCQLGVQLLGHAVSVFRRLGRKRIRLSVFEGNTDAIRFYEEYGFRRIGETDGIRGTLYIMEKEI